jgi:O-antigen ligase
VGTFFVAALVIAFSGSERLSDRMISGYGSVTNFITVQEFEVGESDYKRFVLIEAAKQIISDNFWFGTGVGLTNYRRAFSESALYTDRDSKSHNFYLSYFAELGLIGFVLILSVFFAIYCLLSAKDPRLRFSKAIFLSIAVIMFMSEYILLPEIWFLFGVLAGVVLRLESVATVNYE